MPHQIIRQPDGRLCVFSTVTDTIVVADATPDELADYYAEGAAGDSRRQTARILEAVLADDPRRVYYQFAMTYEQAAEKHLAHDGEPDMVVQLKSRQPQTRTGREVDDDPGSRLPLGRAICWEHER